MTRIIIAFIRESKLADRRSENEQSGSSKRTSEVVRQAGANGRMQPTRDNLGLALHGFYQIDNSTFYTLNFLECLFVVVTIDAK